jgi:hypothetical protein
MTLRVALDIAANSNLRFAREGATSSPGVHVRRSSLSGG